jgi:hypothetical protein
VPSQHSFQQGVGAFHYLVVTVALQLNGLGRAFGGAYAAAQASGRVYL